MNQLRPLSRRTVLKGLGTAMALPLLDAMAPVRALAAAAAPAAPRRMAFVYIPNGAHMQEWTPAAVGTDYELPKILECLAPHKQELLVLTGLAQKNARPLGDGGGDHARASSCFLTGAHPVKTSGADIKVGVSVDQVAAAKIGDQTRLPSLEIGCDRGNQSGNCDSGYSCAYSSNISWKTATTPVAKEVNPRLVFERLFGGGNAVDQQASRAKRQQYQTSILDFVLEDANRLQVGLGATDRRKLDEYLTSVRELEGRIQRVEKTAEIKLPEYAKPAGVPNEFKDHIRLMSDLLVLAFQGDVTRISTFTLANDGSNRSYGFIGVPEGHHDLSHHGGNVEKQAKISKINQFHMEQFAYLVDKLKGIREGSGTLLDNCMVVYGSGISDGDRHNHDNLPILMAGKGGGTIQTGRHVKFDKETPLTNLYLSMLDRIGAASETLGDSSGRLSDLTV